MRTIFFWHKRHLFVLTLFAIILLSLVLGLLQFRFVSRSIERITISESPAPALHKFDEVLKQNLSSLARSDFLAILAENKFRTEHINDLTIASCQVTQSQYNAFAQWATFNNLEQSLYPQQTPKDQTLHSRFLKHKILGRLNAPITGVNYYQAAAYCRASGGRLPTSDEWEAAASGVEQRLYPWGDSLQSKPWRFRNPILNVVQHCGAYPEANTPQGIADMGNSVSEWTKDSQTNKTVLKGGNAFNKPYSLHALNVVSKAIPANFSSQFVGFRCVYDTDRTTIQQSDNKHFVRYSWNEQQQVVVIEGGDYSLGVPNESRLFNILQSVDPEVFTQLAPAFNREASKEMSEVSRYEIQVGEYQWFLRDPLARLNYYANTNQPENHSYIPQYWQEQQENTEAPVTGISWWDAYAFASWAGARLPTVDEWQRWYGGTNSYIYPWGNEYTANKSLVRKQKDFIDKPLSVKESKDANDYGLVGLSGNVSEWTSSLFLGSGERSMIVKGGNYLIDNKESARIDYAAKAPLYHRSKAIGFRIVFTK